MLAALITATMLSQATPVARPEPVRPRAKVTFKLSAGSFIGSVWASPSYRSNLDRLTTDTLAGESPFDSKYLVYSTPVLGPWVTVARGGYQQNNDMLLLVTSGMLQAIGISALTYELVSHANGTAKSEDEGVQLSISPYVVGRLGIALTITGL